MLKSVAEAISLITHNLACQTVVAARGYNFLEENGSFRTKKHCLGTGESQLGLVYRSQSLE